MDNVQKIKERLNIAEVIGEYVKLTKAGKNYKGLSPFKKEKTPSFYVSPDKGMYYDFSSNRGGDIFTFIQEVEGVDFRGALKMLAERAGIELVPEERGVRDARERLYDVLDAACRFFETKLLEDQGALAYLKERGLADHTLRSFRLGFAPEGWRELSDHLVGKGYRAEELEAAGLAKRGERGNLYDRFRSRITFPIMDTAGRVVAFSGRIFGEAAHDEKNAKYLNSPETPLFEKGRILYGYDKAKSFMRKYDFAIFVEGQMDLVMSHQAGYANTVAVSGTGLTEEHLSLVGRLTNNLVFAFDADSAGKASAHRSALLALPRGMDVKIARVPIGKDPADCIRVDPEAWKRAVKESQHIVTDTLSTLANGSREGTETDLRKLGLRVRDTVLPLIARIQSGVDQAHFVRVVAHTLGLAEDAVWVDVRRAAQEPKHAQTLPEDASAGSDVPERKYTRREDLERTLAGFLFWQEQNDKTLCTEESVRTYVTHYQLPIEGILARHTHDREHLAFQAEVAYGGLDARDALSTLMRDLSRVYLAEEKLTLARDMRNAELAHDEARVSTLLQSLHDITIRIEALEKKWDLL